MEIGEDRLFPKAHIKLIFPFHSTPYSCNSFVKQPKNK